jgi:CRISPR-associated protein Csm1
LSAVYADLWPRFLAAWADNRCPAPLGFVNRAAAVLQHFTWRLPAALTARPQVSLFDHLKTTAAIALAKRWSEEQTQPFLLLSGGVNGIQKYIFDIKAGDGSLARRLRARSFQIAVYSEAIVLDLLRRLALPLTQCLHLAGAKFQLLLPHSRLALAALQAAQASAASWLYGRSASQLSLSLIALPLGEDDIKNFASSSARAGALLSRERNREARAILQDNSGWREDMFVIAGDTPQAGEELCPACAQRPQDRNNDGNLCPLCHDQRQLGAEIAASDRVVFFAGAQEGDYAAPPDSSFSLLPKGKALPPGAEAAAHMDGYKVDAEAAAPLIAMPRARYVPRDQDGGSVEFSELGRQAAGQPYLGCLKLDVDNLGHIFSQGLAADKSIARAAALSRALEAFFSVHVEQLLRARFRHVYMIYSGGDDVAAIVPWDLLFDFALNLREDFRRYAGGNPHWGLCAGLAVVPPKLPVTEAMAEAQKLLDKAKSGPGKDRLSAFDNALSWPELKTALDEARQLLGWLRAGAVSSAQARRLLGYARKWQKYHKTRNTCYFEYAPLLHRDLARNWGENDDAQKKARHWAAQLPLPGAEKAMSRLGFVCTYALAANRGKEMSDEQ